MDPYKDLVDRQRQFFKTGATRSLNARRETLLTLKQMLEAHRNDIAAAIYEDIGRDPSFEIAGAVNDTNDLLEKLDTWNALVEVPKPLHLQDDDEVLMVTEPLGVVLVIAAWNFPLVTSMPLASALAGGNTVVLKLSECAPSFSTVFAGLVQQYFDKNVFAAVEGDVPVASALLSQRFDHIMYTGNPTVGRIVMSAASEDLTPVTLLLGGKNPVLVEPDADLDDAAKKIIVSKTLNCGQTCLAADYVITTEAVLHALLTALVKNFEAMAPFKGNRSFSRIINEKHFERLSSLLFSTRGTLVYKAVEAPNKEDKFIPPYVLLVKEDDPLMKDEIFGPILPVIKVKSFDHAIDFIKRREKPLGAYIFTKDHEKVRRFLQETSSGGVTVNDVMTHGFVDTLPFGGVGNSGMGRLSGKYGFSNFVHEKAVLIRDGIGRKVIEELQSNV